MWGAVGAAGLGWGSCRGAAAGSAPCPWELRGYVPVLGTGGLSLDAPSGLASPDVWEDHFHPVLVAPSPPLLPPSPVIGAPEVGDGGSKKPDPPFHPEQSMSPWLETTGHKVVFVQPQT